MARYRTASGERRSRRGEDIAALEGRRPMRARRQLVHRLHADLVDHDRKQPVVRANVEASAGLHDEPPARASDSRIDHREVHRPAREMPRAREEHEGAGRHVKPRNLVAHVH